MKINLLTTAAAIAFASALAAQPAKAQFTAGGAANNGDIILSFYLSGNSTDFEVDLGQFSIYDSAASTINIENIATDLSNDYGSNWFSNGSLTFNLVGSVPAAGGVTDISKGDSLLVSTTSTTAYPDTDKSALGPDVTKAQLLYDPADGSGTAPTDGSSANSYAVPISNGSSYSTLSGQIGYTAISTNFGSGTPSLYLDLLQPGAGNTGTGTSTELPGTFQISSTGEVSYVLAAAPEPSTYALMILGGAALFFWNARRKSVSRS